MITVWDGIIEMVEFEGPYINSSEYSYSKNVDEVMLALNKRWGNYSEIKGSKSNDKNSFYIWFPKSNIIGVIDFIVKSPYLKDDDNTWLTPKFRYISKKLLGFARENKESLGW